MRDRAATSGIVIGLLATVALATAAGAQAPGAVGKAQRKGAARKAGGAEGGGLRRFDAIMMRILENSGTAGGSLAIAKDGRLVLARGYGLADVAAGRPVTTDTLFSLGSVSKTITAAALLVLAERGKVRLDDRLVDVLADIGPLPGHQVADPRFRRITVRHLLHHAGGWDAQETPERGGDDEVPGLRKLRAKRATPALSTGPPRPSSATARR